MDRLNRLNSLELYNKSAISQQIETMFSDLMVFITDLDLFLTFKGDACLR